MIPSLERWPTKAKEAPSPQEVRLTLLGTNPVFQCLGGKLQYLTLSLKPIPLPPLLVSWHNLWCCYSSNMLQNWVRGGGGGEWGGGSTWLISVKWSIPEFPEVFAQINLVSITYIRYCRRVYIVCKNIFVVTVYLLINAIKYNLNEMTKSIHIAISRNSGSCVEFLVPLNKKYFLLRKANIFLKKRSMVVFHLFRW